MKRLIIVAASIALVASVGAASAKTTKKKGHHGGTFIQRDVSMPSGGYHANGDFRYGPQIDYPQSPGGGGY